MNKLVVILSAGLIISIGLNIYQYRLLLQTRWSREPGQTDKPVKTDGPVQTKTTDIAPDDEAESELFPLFGVVLGKTTVSELSELGVKSSEYNYYNIHGFDFWFSETDNKADRMYLICDGALPQKWRNNGFDWRLSYNEWIDLFTEQEYTISIAKLPEVVEFNGYDSFSAKIVATKMHPYPISVTLDFQYSGGISEDSKKTLYSISVSRL